MPQLLRTLPPGERDEMAAEIAQLRAAVDSSALAWKEDCGADDEDEGEDEEGDEEGDED